MAIKFPKHQYAVGVERPGQEPQVFTTDDMGKAFQVYQQQFEEPHPVGTVVQLLHIKLKYKIARQHTFPPQDLPDPPEA